MDGWRVDVEVLVLRLLGADVLGHRWVRGRLPADASPDERAVQLVGCSSGLCHSTSWRQDRPELTASPRHRPVRAATTSRNSATSRSTCASKVKCCRCSQTLLRSRPIAASSRRAAASSGALR